MSDELFRDIAAYLTERRSDNPHEWYFGGCPVCLAPRSAFLYDADRSEWIVCKPCGVKWAYGSGNFGVWADLSPEQRAYQQRALAGLREVKPYHPPFVDEFLAELARNRRPIEADDLDLPFD
jgi:hypothetical protein